MYALPRANANKLLVKTRRGWSLRQPIPCVPLCSCLFFSLYFCLPLFLSRLPLVLSSSSPLLPASVLLSRSPSDARKRRSTRLVVRQALVRSFSRRRDVSPSHPRTSNRAIANQRTGISSPKPVFHVHGKKTATVSHKSQSSRIDPQHKELVKYIHETWKCVKKEYERDGVVSATACLSNDEKAAAGARRPLLVTKSQCLAPSLALFP